MTLAVARTAPGRPAVTSATSEAPAGERSASRTAVAALTLLVLVTGFGDGIAAGLKEATGAASPWMFLLPLLILALLVFWARGNPLPAPRYLLEAFALLSCMMLVLTLTVFLLAKVYISGYLQLAVFAATLILVQGVFAQAPRWLAQAFPGALVIAHYFLCGYVAVALFSWHLAGIDPSAIRLLVPPDATNPFPPPFRPVGFSVEPAWAALAIAASYIGIFCLVPGERLRGFLALVTAAVMLQAGTLTLFSGVFAVAYVMRNREPRVQMALFLLLAMVVAGQLYLSWDRIDSVLDGDDASLRQRASSVPVAWGVIEQSFPIGVGYGNFREFAQYGLEWRQYLNLTEATFYKSDLFPLNFTAELGAFGAVILLWVAWILARGPSILPVAFYGLVLVLSGTLLLPPLLVLTAVVGLLRQRREQASVDWTSPAEAATWGGSGRS